jgi:lysophospholipase L1-like esterase
MRGLKNCGLVCLFLLLTGLASAQQNTWIATWAASPQAVDPSPDDPLLKIADQTVRERVRISIGGTQIRIRLSNEYGSTPLLVGSVTVAVPVSPESIRPKSLRTVTFDGQKSILIPAGAPALSDPIPHPLSTPTVHALGLKRAVLSPPGDHTLAEKIDAAAAFNSSILLSAVLVPAQRSQHLIVAFGDSITDGDRSTMDADHNWPSDLIRRLEGTPEGSKTAVVNEGIAGNRLLGDGFGVNGLARFDRDALALQGVSHIVLLEGINDISFPGAKLGGEYLADPHDARTAEDVILAYRQLISRAHAHGVKLIGATMTPCEGIGIPGYYSESKEAVRQAVNKWIRTSGSFDGVIDFDAVVRDPDHPSRIAPRFASEDHLHPNDAGYQAMADAIDLALLR